MLNELRARRVLTSSYVAAGYGESQPIADNDTQSGREDNRRIEFRLIRPEFEEETETTLDGIAQDMSAKPDEAKAAEPSTEGATPEAQDEKTDSAAQSEPENTTAKADGENSSNEQN